MYVFFLYWYINVVEVFGDCILLVFDVNKIVNKWGKMTVFCNKFYFYVFVLVIGIFSF